MWKMTKPLNIVMPPTWSWSARSAATLQACEIRMAGTHAQAATQTGMQYMSTHAVHAQQRNLRTHQSVAARPDSRQYRCAMQ